MEDARSPQNAASKLDELMTIEPILLLAVFPIYKLITNLFWLYRIKVLKKHYTNYAKELSEANKASKTKKALKKSNGPTVDFVEKMPETQELFRRANVEDKVQTQMEPVGYGRVQQQSYSYYGNMAGNQQDIALWMTYSFRLASGYFKRQAWNSINPVYWVELVLKAPGATLIKLGVKEDSVWPKISNSAAILIVVSAIVWAAFTGKPIRLSLEDGSKKVSVEMNQDGPANKPN